MSTAGAAYLPPSGSPSLQNTGSGKADNKSANSASGQGTGTAPDGETSDFQSELELQNSGAAKTSSSKTSSLKTSAKKRDARPGDGKSPAGAPALPVPVQVAAPQRQIQPITFAPGQPDGKDGQTADRDASQSNIFQDVLLKENAAKDALSAQAATLVSAAPVSLPAPVGLPEVPANTPKRGTARPAGDRDPARQSNLTAADAATVNDAAFWQQKT